tara:strand:+ start:195 stop:563 length:369 start_codon:yes stop_codon:yes gene_type:complete
MIDFDTVLNHADTFNNDDVSRTLAHETYDSYSPSICVHHQSGLSYFIALARNIDLCNDDLSFLDHVDFTTITLSSLICNLDEYCDYDDRQTRSNVLCKLSVLTDLPIYDIAVLDNFFYCKRR